MVEITDWRSHFERIYRAEADAYQRIVAYEDAYGELAGRIDSLGERASRIVDVGAGTGRLTVPLCRPGKQIHGVDVSGAMLDVAKRQLRSCGGEWKLSIADARALPVETGWADAAIAGWVFGHFIEWHPDTWEIELAAAIGEMDRVVKHGGIEVVVDTLGTAVLEPAAPKPLLGEYHSYLERAGFVPTVLRTDYEFDSVGQAIESLEWFFGLGEWARRHNDTVVPEFTGWWERRSP